jgi:N-acetylglucosaminyl-diphospho-decaprenol L-rhamnosyltransferase
MGDVKNTLVVSVVSHGHGEMVQKLLYQLAALEESGLLRVVLTQNIKESLPDAPASGWPFIFEVRSNSTPKGFSANHNAALIGAEEDFLCLMNPDVDLLQNNPFPPLMRVLERPGVGLAYPLQIDDQGSLQDSEREVPTIFSLYQRYFCSRVESRPEWVNAAFWIVKREAWLRLCGLDARFFMYCEDVDFCLRLRLKGWKLARSNTVVRHQAHRDSHRKLKYTFWHVCALVRLWSRPVFWRAKWKINQLSVDELIVQDK